MGFANTLTFAFMHHPYTLFAYFLACHPYIFLHFQCFFIYFKLFSPWSKDTLLIRTIILIPKVSVLERFHCKLNNCWSSWEYPFHSLHDHRFCLCPTTISWSYHFQILILGWTHRFSFLLQELECCVGVLDTGTVVKDWEKKGVVKLGWHGYKQGSICTGFYHKSYHETVALSLGCPNETPEPALHVHSLLLETDTLPLLQNCDKWIYYHSHWFYVSSVSSSASQPPPATLLPKIQNYCPQIFIFS